MRCQGQIRKGVIGANEVGQGTVPFCKVHKEPDRLFIHRLSQFRVENGKSFPIDRVVLLKPSKVQPVSEKLGGEPTHSCILHHAANL